jgi:putative ABC transport system ATP-binding protein
MGSVEPIIEVRGVSKSYSNGESTVAALREASLALRSGELVLIEGPSGSGKTTLLSILGLLLRPSEGRVFVRGDEVTGLSERELPDLRAKNIGFIFQGFNLFGALSARDNVALALQMRGSNGRAAALEAERLLTTVGLQARCDHLPEALSGGQKQRVSIARALAGDPPIILGDEPTAALDTASALSIMGLMRDLAKQQQRAVAIVSHDPRLEAFSDRVVRVTDGRMEEVS